MGAGDQGGVDVELGIMGGSPDEAYGAALEMRKDDVLLSLVEAVNLVDEEDGALFPELGVGAGLLDLLSNIGHIGFHSVQRFETRAGRIGHDPR